jgi:hypothetical protein
VDLKRGIRQSEQYSAAQSGIVSAAGLHELADRLTQYPTSPFFRLRYGSLLGKGGRGHEAAAQYAEAARLLPRHAEAERADVTRHLTRWLAETRVLQVPQRVEYDTTVTFGVGELGTSLLGEGWYPAEKWGVWIRGFTGRFYFTLRPPAGGGGIRLGLEFCTVVHVDRTGTQSVRVFVNGRELALCWFENSASADRTVEVGSWAFAADKIEIAFFCSPADLACRARVHGHQAARAWTNRPDRPAAT